MPAGPRIRDNNVFGTTLDNPLTAGAVTFNSSGLSTLSVVASAHAVVVLDPKRVFGEPEIVVITSHSASATVATITRGQYGTVARSHPQGTSWAHVPVDEDYIEILTAATRPTNPYEGQFIFEADTNKLVGYGGVDWAPRDAGGVLGYAVVTTPQTGITTQVPLTGMSVTAIVGTGRLIRVSAHLDCVQSTATGTVVVPLHQDGPPAPLADLFSRDTLPAGTRLILCGFSILTPSAGSHTWSLQGSTTAGNVGFHNNSVPGYLVVEDIGAA